MAGNSPPIIDPGQPEWQRHHRLVSSQFPPIPLFEDYVDAELLAAAFEVEGRTNPRLRAEAGELYLVPEEDYVLGDGASPVMAAFTHIGKRSRFTDGSFGVYYAANSLNTALLEVKFHRERFLALTHEPPTQQVMRSYTGSIQRPLHDIRGIGYEKYHDPNLASYHHCQMFSAKLRRTKSWGLLYRSVRDPGGECVAFYRPPAVGIPIQSKHFVFHWDGKAIRHTYELTKLE